MLEGSDVLAAMCMLVVVVVKVNISPRRLVVDKHGYKSKKGGGPYLKTGLSPARLMHHSEMAYMYS